MKKYFYKKGDNKIGPLTMDDLIGDKLDENTLVWTTGMEDWLPLKKIEEYKELISISPEHNVSEVSYNNIVPSKTSKMNTYTRILGVLSLLIVMGLAAALVIFTLEEEEWFTSFLLLIPLFILTSYLIHTKFGFKQQGLSKVSLILSLATFLILGITPTTIYMKERKLENEREKELEIRNNEIETRNKELEAKYLEAIDWGEITTAHNIKCKLKTRFDKGKIEYIFKVDYENKEYDISAFIIKFLDSDGFEEFNFEIKTWTSLLGSNSKKVGISANSSVSFDGTIDDYGEMHSYSVAIREK